MEDVRLVSRLVFPAEPRRKTEDEINSFPNYTAKVSLRDNTFDVHFIALFSTKKDAVPLVITHGWPGSILEFLPLFHYLSATYTPEELPVHIVAPSLIGYGFSSPPPIDDDFGTTDNAALFDQLMRGLGFESYVAQGGDVGSLVSRALGADYPACKGTSRRKRSFMRSTRRTPAHPSRPPQHDDGHQRETGGNRYIQHGRFRQVVRGALGGVHGVGVCVQARTRHEDSHDLVCS